MLHPDHEECYRPLGSRNLFVVSNACFGSAAGWLVIAVLLTWHGVFVAVPMAIAGTCFLIRAMAMRKGNG